MLFSYCLAATAGVLWKRHRPARGWRQPLPQLCWSLSRAWARALGSGPGDSCDYQAAEAAEAAGGPGSGRYFGPGLPPPAPVSSGSLGGGTLGSISGLSPSSLFASFPICPEGWEQRPLWMLLGGPGSNPWGLAPQDFPQLLEAVVFLITTPRLGIGPSAPSCWASRSPGVRP